MFEFRVTLFGAEFIKDNGRVLVRVKKSPMIAGAFIITYLSSSCSRKLVSFSARVGCLSFLNAFASI